MSRSTFLKGAGLAGAGMTLGGWAVTARADEQGWDDEADVVVCGCGTTGAPAAIEAHDAGADVLVIEKFDWIGGCMRRCGGGFMAAGTSVQKKLGVDDNADLMYDYLVAIAGEHGDPDLIRVFCDEAASTFDWIIAPIADGGLGGQPLDEWDFTTPDDQGATILIAPGLNIGGTPVYYEDLGMPEKYRPRCHWFKPNPDDVDPGDRYYANYNRGEESRGEDYGGTGLWKPFGDALESRGIRIETQTELVGLVLDDDGVVIGVKTAKGGTIRRIKAKRGVVLASGGFNNDPDLSYNFTGKEYKAPTDLNMWTGSYIPGEADGAALKSAFAAGAAPVFPMLGNNGGVRMTTKAEVVGMDGNPIPRLYAGGRVTGGLASTSYPSCGFYIGTGIVYGRIAGQQAAALEPWE